MNQDKKDFYDQAWQGCNHPEDLKRLSERICNAYGINGICDPAYIGNVIAHELGFGDGRNHFKKIRTV